MLLLGSAGRGAAISARLRLVQFLPLFGQAAVSLDLAFDILIFLHQQTDESTHFLFAHVGTGRESLEVVHELLKPTLLLFVQISARVRHKNWGAIVSELVHLLIQSLVKTQEVTGSIEGTFRLAPLPQLCIVSIAQVMVQLSAFAVFRVHRRVREARQGHNFHTPLNQVLAG